MGSASLGDTVEKARAECNTYYSQIADDMSVKKACLETLKDMQKCLQGRDAGDFATLWYIDNTLHMKNNMYKYICQKF
jgi:hypothetical protein